MESRIGGSITYFTILYHDNHTMPYHTTLYYTFLHYTTLYYTTLYSTLVFSTILYYTILYSTLLYSTLLYSTLLYSTSPPVVQGPGTGYRSLGGPDFSRPYVSLNRSNTWRSRVPRTGLSNSTEKPSRTQLSLHTGPQKWVMNTVLEPITSTTDL